MAKVAFIFPGQGSQALGMMNSFESVPLVRDVLAEASEVLVENIGRLISDGPVEKLNLTTYTQPVLLACSVAIWRLYRENQPTGLPSFLAGHSLGEYSALTAAGCIDFSSAVSFVKFRAEAMQDAVPENVGGMAAIIGVTEECVEDICKSVRENSKNKLCEKNANTETVEVANINTGKQIVISGSNSLLDSVTEKIIQLGKTARVVKLPVSAPFHSSLLAPAKIKLENKLNEIELCDPVIPVLSNVTAKPYKGINEIRELLPLQAISPVLWKSTVETMIRSGIETFVECGPGRVLSGLIKQIDRSVKIYNFKDYDSFTKAMESLNV